MASRPHSPENGSAVPRRSSVFSNSAKYSAALANVNPVLGDDNKKSYYEEFKHFLKRILTHSWIGTLYEGIILAASVISTLEFIYQTYISHERDHLQMTFASKIELAYASLFGLDWVLNMIIADRVLYYFLSFYSIVDIIIVVSVITTFNRDPIPYEEIQNVTDVIYYILFGMKTVRVLRSVWCNKKLAHIEDAVQRYIGEISLSICVMILFFAALMQYLERHSTPLLFHTWMYYIWVTLSTVGYGDIAPQSTLGRIAAMAIIGVAIVSIPSMTNQLVEKMSLQSVYMRAVYTPKTKRSKHILICGDLSSTSLNEFFEELYHIDHENTDLNAVILLPTPPTVEMILLMRDRKFSAALTYLEGSALTGAGLRRAKAESAEAIFIMTNKFSMNPDEEDAKSILLNLSIKKYLTYFYNCNTMFCMQLIRPQNKRHLQREEFTTGGDNDLTVCLNEIKLGVMAKAVMYPGCNTLVMNLISSFSDDDLNVEDYVSPDSPSNQWLQEYLKGCGWEIYTTPLSEVFTGLKFCELSYALYDKLGVVLFALQLTDHKNGGYSKVLLNPASFVIPGPEEYGVEAFVIAENKASSDLSFSRPSKFSGITSIGSIARVVKSSIDPLSDRKIQKGSENPDPSLGTTAPKSKWDLIKKNSALRKKIDSSNYEEILHKLEDEHCARNYYLRSTPVDISEVMIKTEVIAEIPFVNNHVIVLGRGLRNLYDLIKPLRAKYIGPLRHIVIVYPYDIPHDVWQKISIFDAIVIVRGSPLEDNNLRRAGIFRAAQVVVLAEGANSNSNSMDALVDSDAIFAYQHIKRMNPNTQVVIEVVNQSSISFLHTDPESKHANFKLTPLYASGTLFTTASLDSIICQTYYNPQVLKVVNQLLSGIDQVTGADISIEATKQYLLAVDRTSSSSSEKGGNGENNNNNNETPLDFVRNYDVQRMKSGLLTIEGSCLYQIPIPETLQQKTYGALFKHLVKDGIIPLGLLRGTFNNMSLGPKSNTLPYVYTNPDKNTEIFTCDRVFVLSVKPQQVVKMDMKNWVKEIVTVQSNSKDPLAALLDQKKKAAAAAATGTQSVPMPMDGSGISGDQLERKLADVVKQLNIDFTMKLAQTVQVLKTEIAEQIKANMSNITINMPEFPESSAKFANGESQREQSTGFDALYSEDSDRDDHQRFAQISPAPPNFGKTIEEESKELDVSIDEVISSEVRKKPESVKYPSPGGGVEKPSTPQKSIVGPSAQLVTSALSKPRSLARSSPGRSRSSNGRNSSTNTNPGQNTSSENLNKSTLDDDNGSVTSTNTAQTNGSSIPTIVGPSISMLKFPRK